VAGRVLLCPKCRRTYGDDAKACAYDGEALQSAEAVATPPGEHGPGDLIGVYRVLNRVGTGGMGIIYRAEHVRLGRKVALKVLRQEISSRADVVARFFSEARSVNEIGHPNIIDIIDFVEDRSRQPPLVYTVMELLKGQTVAQRVRTAHPLDPQEVVKIALQVTDALVAVHRVQILHRDLKPENIFLAARDDGTVAVKLFDFGLATAFGDRDGVHMTDPGTVVGTPEYMAPEQILGRSLDARTDIYSLGLVLYDMLTNTVPFQSTKYGELLIQQVKEAPEPVAARRGSQGAPVPAALEDAVMRCLRKSPAQRFQSMEELHAALEKSLNGAVAARAVATPRPCATSPVRLEAPETRELVLSTPRRRPLVLGLLVVVGVAAGLGFWALRRGDKHLEQPAARLPAAARPRPPDAGRRDLGPAPDLAPARPAAKQPPITKRPVGERSNVVKKGQTKSKKGGKKKGGGIEGTIDPFGP
jgi:serine/threonine protein kinase